MSGEKQGMPPPYDQSVGYPAPQQGGYPPQQGGYPPPQGGYPPQQGGNLPPQQGGYPAPYPQQGGYPQAQPGYQPVPQGYAPPPGQYGQPGQPYTTQTVVVSQPGQAGVLVTQPRPPDYLVPSCLACFCCFCPTGLVAIYYAWKANQMVQEGDMAEAGRMANNARNMMIASVVIGICWIILVTVLRLVVYSSRGYSY